MQSGKLAQCVRTGDTWYLGASENAVAVDFAPRITPQNPPGFHPIREEDLKGFTPVLMIRLARFGARKQPYYRVVVIEKDRARNGRSIEVVGTYNPRTSPATVDLKRERIEHWTNNGAQLSERVAKLLTAYAPAATAA
jgi:small subunit ribosomal protein S16